MSTEPAIRHATADDITEIQAVATASWHETYSDTLAEQTRKNALETWYSEDALREQVDDSLFFVATRDGAVIGFVHAQDSTDHTEIVRLYVHPDNWRDGTGSALMDRLYTEIDDGTTLRVEVLAENVVGTSFYASHGFDRIDTTETSIQGEIVEQNIMERTL